MRDKMYQIRIHCLLLETLYLKYCTWVLNPLEHKREFRDNRYGWIRHLTSGAIERCKVNNDCKISFLEIEYTCLLVNRLNDKEFTSLIFFILNEKGIVFYYLLLHLF